MPAADREDASMITAAAAGGWRATLSGWEIVNLYIM